jgi:integrase
VKKRRGPGEGTIRERSDGRWEARATLDIGGVAVRRSFFGKSHREVAEKLAKAQVAARAGLVVPGERLTVATYLDNWLRDVVAPSVRPRTYETYEMIVRVHLKPGLGRHRLSGLTAAQVQSFLNAKGSTGHSPNTVRHIRAVLRCALNQARRWGLVAQNVATLVQSPRVPRSQVCPLSVEEAGVFMRHISGDRMEALYLLAMATGMRQGELLGLRWADVDVHARSLTVRTALARRGGGPVLVEPKSATGHRTIPLPDIAIEALRAHRVRQVEDRMLAGTRWLGEPWGLVFTSKVGTPLDGITVLRRFQRLLKEAGLRKQRFHDLRHAAASFMLAGEVPLRVIMETLGHSDIRLTANTYSHLAPALARESADRMDMVLAAAVKAS